MSGVVKFIMLFISKEISILISFLIIKNVKKISFTNHQNDYMTFFTSCPLLMSLHIEH
jgi:ABC-type arginine/histidine transport system permease subunit